MRGNIKDHYWCMTELFESIDIILLRVYNKRNRVIMRIFISSLIILFLTGCAGTIMQTAEVLDKGETELTFIQANLIEREKNERIFINYYFRYGLGNNMDMRVNILLGWNELEIRRSINNILTVGGGGIITFSGSPPIYFMPYLSLYSSQSFKIIEPYIGVKMGIYPLNPVFSTGVGLSFNFSWLSLRLEIDYNYYPPGVLDELEASGIPLIVVGAALR